MPIRYDLNNRLVSLVSIYKNVERHLKFKSFRSLSGKLFLSVFVFNRKKLLKGFYFIQDLVIEFWRGLVIDVYPAGMRP